MHRKEKKSCPHHNFRGFFYTWYFICEAPYHVVLKAGDVWEHALLFTDKGAMTLSMIAASLIQFFRSREGDGGRDTQELELEPDQE